MPSEKAYKLVSQDETPRATTLEALAALKLIRAKIDSEASVTSSNASTQNDGASASIVASQEALQRCGLKPFARMLSWAVVGVEPARMGIGPVPAIEKALLAADPPKADIDLIELNEAFASKQPISTG